MVTRAEEAIVPPMRAVPAIATIFLIPLAACGGGARQAPGAEVAVVVNPAAAPPTTTGTPGCPELPVGPVVEIPGLASPAVTVLDPGTEPRHELRYRPQAGARMTLTFRIDMAMVMTGASTLDLVLPTTVLRVINDVLAVEDDGTIVQRIVFDEAYTEARAGTLAEVTQAMETSLDSLECDLAVQRVDPQGHIVGMRVIGPGTLATNMGQLDGMSSPLPATPVGLGASWQVTEHVTRNGIAMDRVVTYDLTGIDGDVIHLRGLVDISSPPSDPTSGAATPVIVGTGGFEAEIDLGAMAPQLRQDSDIKTETTDAGATTSTRLTMTLGITTR